MHGTDLANVIGARLDEANREYSDMRIDCTDLAGQSATSFTCCVPAAGGDLKMKALISGGSQFSSDSISTISYAAVSAHALPAACAEQVRFLSR